VEFPANPTLSPGAEPCSCNPRLDLKSGIKEQVVDPAAIRDHLLKEFPQAHICHSFKELSEE